VPFRRHAEVVVASLPVLALLTVPLVIAPRPFWPWAAPFESLPPVLQHALRPKAAYFHPAFFSLRAIAYWATWLTWGEWLRRASQGQAAGANGVAVERLRVASATGIPLTALALTFASFDWMMSTSPDWSSSVYGMYYFAGAMVSALAIVAILGARPARQDEWSPTSEHFQALGRLTLAFVLLWAYLWYDQFFIIWIADIPREVTWYAVRMSGSWRVLAVSVVVGGFVLPFLALAFRAARGSSLVMPVVGAWLLVVHYLDIYWLVVPSVRSRWSIGNLLWDAASIVLVVGSAIALSVWRQESVPPLAAADPRMELSLRYQAH
jgi:hypothetical protein